MNTKARLTTPSRLSRVDFLLGEWEAGLAGAKELAGSSCDDLGHLRQDEVDTRGIATTGWESVVHT